MKSYCSFSPSEEEVPISDNDHRSFPFIYFSKQSRKNIYKYSGKKQSISQKVISVEHNGIHLKKSNCLASKTKRACQQLLP